ncbi:MAG: ATP-binding protein [Calditrichaceae bacterium]|nr:ATP-binding protein [Calditrichaceae bacterium]MBN2709908.1 ATP-binding protein [Calditrichaceae bacterium]RQV92662.1 MAG: ATP-binding protein [Calditrichota bacterium]
MENNVKLKMTLPDIPDIELVAVEGLDKMARHLGISDEKIGEARILVTEAIINAIEHSGKEKMEVDVEFTMTKEKLVIFVRDYGQGFKPESVEEPDILKKMGTENKRGWGLKIMKSMSDDFLIESNENGTKITLIKNLV